MERPDIKSYKEGLKRCCGRKVHPSFCESWGCAQIVPLIAYIEFLEQNLASDLIFLRKKPKNNTE